MLMQRGIFSLFGYFVQKEVLGGLLGVYYTIFEIHGKWHFGKVWVTGGHKAIFLSIKGNF